MRYGLHADPGDIRGCPCSRFPEKKYFLDRSGHRHPCFRYARGLSSIRSSRHLLLFSTVECGIDGVCQETSTGSKCITGRAFTRILINAFACNSVVKFTESKMISCILLLAREKTVGNTQHPRMRCVRASDFSNRTICEGIGIIFSSDASFTFSVMAPTSFQQPLGVLISYIFTLTLSVT